MRILDNSRTNSVGFCSEREIHYQLDSNFSPAYMGFVPYVLWGLEAGIICGGSGPQETSVFGGLICVF